MRLHNRQIKATFWNDTDLLQWPRDKRWFYEGLIQLADDSGCLEDSPFAFKLNLFPSPVDADITVDLLAKWRDELIEDGKLVRYRVGKKDYLYLTNFHKHQSLKNPEKPDVPLPPWIRWEPYESNNRAGKYVVSEDVLTAFLRQSDEALPIEIEREIEREEEEKRTEITTTTTTRAHEEIWDDDYPRSVDEAFRRVFNLNMIPPIFTRFLAQVIPEYGEQYAIELILEAGESSRGQPNLRYIQQIHEGWVRRGIRSREEAKRARDEQKRAPPADRRSSQLDMLARLEKQFAEQEAETCDTS